MPETPDGNGAIGAEDRAGARSDPSLAREKPGPEAFARSGHEPAPEQPSKVPLYKRPLVRIIGLTVIVVAVVIGVLWYLHARQFEKTDDAFIEADVTQVSPRVAGHVVNVYVSDNQFVQEKDPLIDLDPADFQAKVAEQQALLEVAQSSQQQAIDNAAVAQADVGSAQAIELASQTEATRADDELKRYESLSPEARTQQQIINLRAASRSAQANLEAARKKTVSAQAHAKLAQSQIIAAKAQVAQARAALDQTKLQLGYTRIGAPIAGNVTSKSVQTGDYVQIGQALLALVPRDAYVIANYKETQLTLMKPGQDAEFTVDAYPGHVFHGKVQSIQRGTGAAFSLLPPENATGNYVKVVQRVPVKITFQSEPDFPLGVGMSVVPKVKVR